MAEIIDGKRIAREIRTEVKEGVEALAARGIEPGLCVVLVGDDPGSTIYVRMKARACEEAGIYSRIVRLPADTSQEELEQVIEEQNADDRIHGILVQLPLPSQIEEREILHRVDPRKDVDGFHPLNVGRMTLGDPTAFRPATPAGIIEMLLRTGVDPAGQRATVVGRSNIVGRPLATLLSSRRRGGNATVTLAHSRTPDLFAVTRAADILVAAVGRPEFITAEGVKPGAVVVDVGVNRVEDGSTGKGYRLVGDVDFEGVSAVAGAITPVPGGVGPMTIAMLLRNCLDAAESISDST